MKNIFLIDINKPELIVTSYLVTKNRHDQLILRYVGEIGKLEELHKLESENAYIAVNFDGYQSKSSSKFVTTFSSEKYNMQYTVATIKHDNNDGRNEIDPFRIKIFPNNLVLSVLEQSDFENNYITMAKIQLAKNRADNGKVILAKGDNKKCILYEFNLTETSDVFDVTQLEADEEKDLFSNIPKVIWEFNSTGSSGTINTYSYKLVYDFFTDVWAEKVLKNMNEFFCEENEKLIPRIDGSWSKKYIEGISFPYRKYFKKIPSKEEWKFFLTNTNLFPIFFPIGNVG